MTTLLARIGAALPIIQAPMAGTSTPAMAAAATNAGALGSIGVAAVNAATARPAVERSWLAALAPLFQRYDAQAPATIREIYTSFVADPGMLEMLLETKPARNGPDKAPPWPARCP